MFINLRTLVGKLLVLGPEDISCLATISDVKDMLVKKFQFERDNISILYQAEILNDGYSLDKLDLQPNDFLVIHEKKIRTIQHPHAIAKISINNQKSPLMRTSRSKNSHEHSLPNIPLIPEDPKDFTQNVMELVGLGFDLPTSISALRECKYDLDASRNFLYTGERPKFVDKPKKKKVEVKPVTYQYQQPKIKSKPTVDLSKLRRYNFGNLSRNVENMPTEKKAELIRVLEHDLARNRSPIEVVQYFEACEFDYTITIHCFEEANT